MSQLTKNVSIFYPKNCYFQAFRNMCWESGKNLSLIRIKGPKNHRIRKTESYLVSRHLISAHDVGQFSGQLHRCCVPVGFSY
jgi:hypothetical protein